MIVEIGEWVLENACRENQKLVNLSFNVQINANISGKQLNHPFLDSTVTKILRDFCANPASLELEITENSMFENIDYAIDVIQKLKNLASESPSMILVLDTRPWDI